MVVRYKQVLSDYEYLRENGVSYDFCGATCNTDAFLNILQKRTTIVAELTHLIKAYWENGYEDKSLNEWRDNDKRCQRIKERYYI